MSELPRDNETELIEFVRAIDERAPEELHERVGALVAERSRGHDARGRTSRPWRGVLAGLAAAVAAAALAIALTAGSGGSGAPVLSAGEAATLSLRPATIAAPAQSSSASAQLAANVEGVAFPYWEDRFGWRSVGARTDRIGGRTVTTVFYANRHGQQIAYAIVAGTPAPSVPGGVAHWRGGTSYRLLSAGGSRLVMWKRDGRLCVLAGRGVSDATLLKLASWSEHGENV